MTSAPNPLNTSPLSKVLCMVPTMKGSIFVMILCVNSQGEAMVVYDDEAAAKAAIMWYNGM